MFQPWLGLTLAAALHRASLAVAVLTHPDGPAAPASLRHRHPLAGAGVAEALAARAAVVLPLGLHEHLFAVVTGLEERRGEEGLELSSSKKAAE